jgi:hypothetical protein
MAKFSSNGSVERMKFYFKDKQNPPYETYAELDALLSSGFAATQAHVHTRTSALRFSGSKSSKWGRHSWSGEVSYGGEGVKYAVYEQQRGGDHDFMYPLRVTLEQMDEVIRRMG